jgi:UDP:flavonoid glycosyltransferase YjiC (YdhE family)
VPSQRSYGEPLFLVSLSTQNYDGQVKALQSILTALGGLRVRALVTTGPAVDPRRVTAPPNAELQRFVPHAEVMPKASLVVGHGGHATTMAALAHGLPLVVMPMLPIDEVMIGRVLEARGAARLISKKSSTGRIASAIGELLDGATHREAAERLGAAIRRRDGAMEGADQLEALLLVPASR